MKKRLSDFKWAPGKKSNGPNIKPHFDVVSFWQPLPSGIKVKNYMYSHRLQMYMPQQLINMLNKYTSPTELFKTNAQTLRTNNFVSDLSLLKKIDIKRTLQVSLSIMVKNKVIDKFSLIVSKQVWFQICNDRWFCFLIFFFFFCIFEKYYYVWN